MDVPQVKCLIISQGNGRGRVSIPVPSTRRDESLYRRHMIDGKRASGRVPGGATTGLNPVDERGVHAHRASDRCPGRRGSSSYPQPLAGSHGLPLSVV